MTNELGNQCTKWMIDKFQLNSFGSRTSKILIAFLPISVQYMYFVSSYNGNKLYEYAQIF